METILNKFLDLPIHRDFVRPELCKYLSQLGLYSKIAYSWKISKKDMKLYTRAFDIDTYYNQAENYIDSINGFEETPAYSLSDCFLCFASIGFKYNITYDGNEYYLFPADSSFIADFPPVTGKRLPDVLAEALSNLLKGNLAPATKLNTVLAPEEFIKL